jgi:glycyl-tRNA synthetase
MEDKVEKKKFNKVEAITNIASKRGIFFQTAEIYGGKAGFYSYGHLGKLLKNNFENLWRGYFLSLNENFYEVQSNNILPEKVFQASGHIENFNDPLTECLKCHFRFRADQFLEDKGIENPEILSVSEMNGVIKKNKLKCPRCGGDLGDVRLFNMMFPVPIGFNDEKAYLSPETAQAAYLLFKQEFEATRKKLPLGLAIIDKAYRNEISPRQLFFRLREFTQAELQIFFDSDKLNNLEDEKWKEIKGFKLLLKQAKDKKEKLVGVEEAYKILKIPKFYLYHMVKVQQFYLDVLNIPKEKFRLRELSKEERAFYNKIHYDIEVNLEAFNGFKEIGGIHYRTDHDLSGHEKVSGKKQEVFYEDKKVLPHVLELSFGVDRNIWALLDVFYAVGKEGSMFKFPMQTAPIKVAIFPLVKREGMDKIAEQIYHGLRKEFSCFLDVTGSIGRRYARADEIGIPYCITVDGDTLKDGTVTIRDRDTLKQERVKVNELKSYFEKLMNSY